MEPTCWQLRHRPFQSLNSHHLVVGCAVKIVEILLFASHAHYRELMMLLRRIQNISPFGRWGVRNVSPARIFGILRNSTVCVSPTLEAGFERNSAVSASPEVKMESTCWQLRHRPFQSLNLHHWVIDCAVKNSGNSSGLS